MIILDGNTHKFQAVLAGAVSTDQPEFQATYGQLDASGLDTYATNQGELNSTTDVDIVVGVASKQIGIKSISVFNRDDAQVIITFKKDISATDRFLYRAVLEVNESVHYESARGWYISNANGIEKAAPPDLSGLTFGIQFFIATGADATYILDQFASFAYKIISAVAETASGTITLEVNIDGTEVTGIHAMAITSTESTDTATGQNSVAAGATVDFIFTSNSSALGLSVKLNCTRD